MLSLSLRIFDRDGDKSVSRGEMKGIVENLFHLIAESRREDKSPKEVRKTHTAFPFGAHPKILLLCFQLSQLDKLVSSQMAEALMLEMDGDSDGSITEEELVSLSLYKQLKI